MHNRYETMIDGEFEHGFAVDWMRKDLGFVWKRRMKYGASLPVTAIVDQFYKTQHGRQSVDTSS
jgi:3-hydroxyisobutyrate dehydrogenase